MLTIAHVHPETANDSVQPRAVKLTAGGRWHRPKIDVFRNGEEVVTACNVVGRVVKVSTDSRTDCRRCAEAR